MKLLVAVDGSEHALKAVKTAAKMLKECGGEIILISAVPDISHLGLIEMGYRDKLIASLQKKAEEAIETAKEVLKGEGITADSSLLPTGDPADEIVNAGRKEGVDVIVVGSRGLTGLPHYLLGSVAQKVVTHASCSVLVVK